MKILGKYICWVMLVGAAMAEDIVLPTHDGDEHTAEHYLVLASMLFPEDVVVQVEKEFMASPCGCGCGQLLVECLCTQEP